MKLIKKAYSEFDPTKIVYDENIFCKKTKKSDGNDDEFVDEREFSDGGLFSKRIFGDAENAADDYSCSCGNLRGRFYEGTVCEFCGTEVKNTGINIDKVGWIDISGDKYDDSGAIVSRGQGWKIIRYVAYGFLEKIIGRDNLRNIIHVPDTITVMGNLDTDAIKAVQDSDPKAKYWYIGLPEFYAKYAEILKYYIDLRDFKDTDIIGFVSNPLDVFTDKIVVLPAALRPVMRIEDGVKIDAINNIYISLIKYSNTLNSPMTTLDIIKNSMLEMIEASLFTLTQHVFDIIKGKEGLIRSEICGTRVNYSARAIITPAGADVPFDGLAVPYRMMVGFYRFELINILTKIKKISYKNAEDIVFRAGVRFDEEVYDILEHMVETKEIGVLFNRNPSINIGSIVYLRIVKIKKPVNGDIMQDLTMSCSNTVLTPMGADYDGDTLNIVALKDEKTRQIMKSIFDPINLIIDPKNGRFNNGYGLEKDQVLGMNALLH